jgi:hypothetical protein
MPCGCIVRCNQLSTEMSLQSSHDGDIYFAMLDIVLFIHFSRDAGSFAVDVQHHNSDDLVVMTGGSMYSFCDHHSVYS